MQYNAYNLKRCYFVMYTHFKTDFMTTAVFII